MKISQLQAFVAVANHGNFSTAALELGLAQSTVSHAIATLEEELDVILLVRGRHGAVLTFEGEQILQDARQVLQLINSIRQKASFSKGLQGGQVRLVTVRSIATHILPEMIARFRQAFPLVRVAIAEHDRYIEVEQSLRDGQADIGITNLPAPPEFETWELFRDEFIVLLPPNTLSDEVPLSWEQLAAYPMIMTPTNYQHYGVIRDHLLKFDQTLRVDYEVKEDSTIISMVKQGLGITIMAQLAAEPIPPELQVRSLPVPLERVIGVAIVSDALLSRAVFAFLDVLKGDF
ncbi:MAG TPA: LysR family transcriptional regulator [Crinalium sp.]